MNYCGWTGAACGRHDSRASLFLWYYVYYALRRKREGERERDNSDKFSPLPQLRSSVSCYSQVAGLIYVAAAEGKVSRVLRVQPPPTPSPSSLPRCPLLAVYKAGSCCGQQDFRFNVILAKKNRRKTYRRG